MAYPEKPSGNYELRNYDFGTTDSQKVPMDEQFFKQGYRNADESQIDSVPDAHEQNWLFDLFHKNLKYAVNTAEENRDLLSKKMATPESLGQVKVGYGLEISPDGTLSVKAGIAENAQLITYDLPIGSYLLWGGKTAPEYFIEPDGMPRRRSEYPELYQYIEDNDLWDKLYTRESENSEYFTPIDIRDNFIKIVNNDAEVGKYTPDGLPNLYGRFSQETSNMKYDGVFSVGATVASKTSAPDGSNDSYIIFDASKYNPIYGNSTKVTPANRGLRIVVKALPTPPSSAVPTGAILTYTGLYSSSALPAGYLFANGATLRRTDYSELFNWASNRNLIKPQSTIPNTPHGFYGDGDGSTTFTIPNLMGIHPRYLDPELKYGGTNVVGTFLNDGLPNIIGQFGPVDDMSGTVITGAFYYGGARAYDASSQWSGGGWYVNFDASRSNAIYGRSTYVQPKSVSLLPILKYV